MNLNLKDTWIFQEKLVPEGTSLSGMSALVQALDVEAPVRKPVCVSSRRIKDTTRDIGEWRIFDSKYAVEDTAEAHLVFALRHEDLDLLVLKRVFLALAQKTLVAFV